MIYFRYIHMVVASQLQYRTSAWMTLIGQLLSTVFMFWSLELMFERFGSVQGFSFAEVVLCFGVTMAAFAIAECVARGFDRFETLIVEGGFDRLMLRPRSTILQVLGGSFELGRLGRLLPSLYAIALGIARLPEPLSPIKGLLLFLMVLCGVFVFAGVFILGASACFFTIQGLEFINIFTYGGRELASYPLPIYERWVVRFFTFVIPFGCFNYLPLLFVVGRVQGNALLYLGMPLLGMLFIVPCLWVWDFGVRHYLSAGS